MTAKPMTAEERAQGLFVTLVGFAKFFGTAEDYAVLRDGVVEHIRTAQREAWLAARDAAAECATDPTFPITHQETQRRIRALPVPQELLN